MERIDIAIAKLFRLEGRRSLVDDAGSKIEHVLIRRIGRQTSEICLRLGYLVGIAQNFHDQPPSAGFDRYQLFPSTDRQLAKSDLLCLSQRIPQHGIGLFCEVIGGYDEIGLLVIKNVDRIGLDKLDEVEGLAALNLDRFDFLLFEQHIIAF